MSLTPAAGPVTATPLATGTEVRVRDDWPEARGPAHIRTPHYLRGRRGTVLRHLGDYPNPEDLAFARPAPRLPLYHVAFPAEAIWGGTAGHEVVVEVFGHWLEAAGLGRDLAGG